MPTPTNLLANIQEPSDQPPPKIFLSIIDTNQDNIKKWAILDSEATRCFLVRDVTGNTAYLNYDLMTVTIADGNSTHTQKRSTTTP